VPQGETAVRLVNVPAPTTIDVTDDATLAKFDLLHVPGTFAAEPPPSQFVRWWVSRSALEEGAAPIRSLRGGHPGEIPTVIDRVLGLLLSVTGKTTLVVFVPDPQALEETDWWSPLIRPRVEQAGARYVDLTPEVTRTAAASSLEPTYFLASRVRDEGLSDRGASTVAELVAPALAEVLGGR